MKPIPSVFTRSSWDSYNLYYQEFRTFLINNKGSLVDVTAKRINGIFMANLSFPKSMLDLEIYGFTSMVASIAEIQIFLKHEMKHIEIHGDPVIHINNTQVSKQKDPGPRLRNYCWNCSPLDVEPHVYGNCMSQCRFCTAVCKGTCAAFEAYAVKKREAAKIRKAARLASTGNKVCYKLVSSHVPTNIMHTSIPNTSTVFSTLPILDSGATSSCVNDLAYIMPNTLYIPPIPNSLGVVTLSDGSTTLPIMGTGRLAANTNIIVKYVPQLGESLISIGDHIVDRNNIVIFDKNKSFCISCDDVASTKYNDLINYSTHSNLIS